MFYYYPKFPQTFQVKKTIYFKKIEFISGNSERTLSADFHFAPDGFGSRFACKDSGASHFK